MAKAQYHTKQMDELAAYLRASEGRHLTVHEICAHFRAQGVAVGTTTVYRNLERMVEQGLVAKYQVDNKSAACFAYLGGGAGSAGGCYHCKCEVCGKLIHLRCQEVGGMGRHLLASHGFALDTARTVFYGVCAECRAAGRTA